MLTIEELSIKEYTTMTTITDLKTAWKNLHDSKSITIKDQIALCILKAVRAKNKSYDEKVSIARHLLRKTFSPVVNSNKLLNGRLPFDVVSYGHNKPYIGLYKDKYLGNGQYEMKEREIFGLPCSQVMTSEELSEFESITNVLTKSKALIRRYTYIFTRQDIFDEYQLVQSAHVALELGAKLETNQVKDLYFTVCGVADLNELEEVERVLRASRHEYVVFREPDIGNQKTSIAVFPIEEHRKGVLKSYRRLRFPRGKEVW